MSTVDPAFARKVMEVADLLERAEPTEAASILASAVITIAMDRIPGGPNLDFIETVVELLEGFLTDGPVDCEKIHVSKLSS